MAVDDGSSAVKRVMTMLPVDVPPAVDDLDVHDHA
jgi:hypothetical protein